MRKARPAYSYGCSCKVSADSIYVYIYEISLFLQLITSHRLEAEHTTTPLPVKPMKVRRMLVPFCLGLVSVTNALAQEHRLQSNLS
jgi:hypothetical protein